MNVVHICSFFQYDLFFDTSHFLNGITPLNICYQQCFCFFFLLVPFSRYFLIFSHLTLFFMAMVMADAMQPSTTHMVCPSSFSCHKFSYMTGKLICLLLFTIFFWVFDVILIRHMIMIIVRSVYAFLEKNITFFFTLLSM